MHCYMSFSIGSDDFTSITNSLLTFPPGTTDGEMFCVNITIFGDTVHEAVESFNYSFTTVNPSDSIENGRSGIVIILNDDGEHPFPKYR